MLSIFSIIVGVALLLTGIGLVILAKAVIQGAIEEGGTSSSEGRPDDSFGSGQTVG